MTTDSLNKLTLAQLKKLCEEKGVDTKGTKAVLISRLEEAAVRCAGGQMLTLQSNEQQAAEEYADDNADLDPSASNDAAAADASEHAGDVDAAVDGESGNGEAFGDGEGGYDDADDGAGSLDHRVISLAASSALSAQDRARRFKSDDDAQPSQAAPEPERGAAAALEQQKRLERMRRFGMDVAQPLDNTDDTQSKLEARKKRFGGADAAPIALAAKSGASRKGGVDAESALERKRKVVRLW
jgi:hypothetical protein